MKRTPDVISKKRQELGRQIEVCKNKKHHLKISSILDPNSNRINELQMCELEIQKYEKELLELNKKSKPGKIFFKNIRRLHTGVF